MVKNAGSADAIWAELDAGVAQGKAVVVFNWSQLYRCKISG